MIVLGIDPGSQVTGYGIVSYLDGRLGHIASGVIQLGSYKDVAARLSILYEGVRSLIKTHHPTDFAIEDIFVSKNIRSALTLGHARGTCILAALHAKLAVHEYSAKEVKLAVVGRGSAGKNQVAFMTQKLLKLADTAPSRRLDESDALAVAICHAHRGGLRQRPSTRSWKDYVRSHPERVKNRST